MKITVLMENTSYDEALVAEHGLSVLVETNKHSLLVDTGASPKTWENARTLGVDLTKIDTVVLSHGHYDHSGGLMTLPAYAKGAQIYLREGADGDYHSIKEVEGETHSHYIGIDKAIMSLPALHIMKEDYRIDEEIFLFGNVTGRRAWPKSNLSLKQEIKGKLLQDSFAHEQYVVVEAKGKKLLISGCAHNGILNILDRFREIYDCDPDAVITGFHMMKQTEYSQEELEIIQKTGEELKNKSTVFYSGHCTGKALGILQKIMTKNLVAIHTGYTLEL